MRLLFLKKSTATESKSNALTVIGDYGLIKYLLIPWRSQGRNEGAKAQHV